MNADAEPDFDDVGPGWTSIRRPIVFARLNRWTL